MPLKAKAERRIIIEKTENTVRAALVHDGEPIEFMDTGQGRESIAGNIYAGVVEGVNKNGFAFVDIGQERNAFLNLNDNKDADSSGLIKAGDSIAVQVTRDAYKDKGAYITTKLTWSGRFFVIEHVQHTDVIEHTINISKKITSESERARLTRITEELLENIPLPNKNIIIRTDAAGAASSFLENELSRLAKSAAETETNIKDAETFPLLAYKPHSSACAMLAAELLAGTGSDVREIIINDADEHALLSELYSSRGIKTTLSKDAVFLTHNLSKAYETTKNRLVHLPSGGRIIIDKTEACVVIDVNSAQHSGNKPLEDMALKINTEAAKEAAKQLRLRNLGGIIIIDFIRMKDAENIAALTQTLKDELSKDPTITTVEGFTKLGLMEMTRRRR
jgi:ribonuclease G